MKQVYIFLMAVLCLFAEAQLTFTVTSTGSFSLTCAQHTVVMNASSNYSGTVNYSWTGPGNFNQTGPGVSVTMPGNYSVNASSGTLTASQTLAITVNTTVPASSPGSLIAVTSATTLTLTAVSPTVNFQQYVFSPQGGTITSNNSPMMYPTSGPGTYTYCLVNLENGCSTCPPGVGGMNAPWVPGTVDLVKEHLMTGVRLWSADGAVHMQGHSVAVIGIYSLQGSLVRTVLLGAHNQYSESVELPAGLYVIRSEEEALKLLVQ